MFARNYSLVEFPNLAGRLSFPENCADSAQSRLAHFREARSWFQKSQEIYRTFLDAGTLVGEDAARLDTVIAEIARCDAAIARLTGN
jgi:hypothetical protein